MKVLAFAAALVGVSLAVVTPADAGIDEAPVAKPLAPMDRPPDLQVGHKRHLLKNGKPYVTEVVARDDKATSWKNNEGCSWVLPRQSFAPDMKWSRCRGPDGEQEITGREGDVWPLTVGKTWSYAYRGRNVGGGQWSGTRACKVEGTARVTIRSGAHDTYKVVCKDTRWTRTYYVSPAMQTTVLFTRARPGEEEVMELVSREN